MTEQDMIRIAKAEGAHGLNVPAGAQVKDALPTPFPGLITVVVDNGDQYEVLIVDGHVVRERSLSAVGKYLRAIDFLHIRQFDVDTLCGLLDVWGEPPTGFRFVSASHEFMFNGQKGELRFEGDRAVLTVYTRWIRPTPDLFGGGVSMNPYQTFLRGTLEIALDYALRWRTERIDTPLGTEVPEPGKTWRPFNPGEPP